MLTPYDLRLVPRFPDLRFSRSVLCPLHISRSDAPIVPQCCRLGQCEWVPDPESAGGATSGGRRAILNMFDIARRRRPIGSRRDVKWFRPDMPPTISEANRGIGLANVKRALALLSRVRSSPFSLCIRPSSFYGITYFSLPL